MAACTRHGCIYWFYVGVQNLHYTYGLSMQKKTASPLQNSCYKEGAFVVKYTLVCWV